MKSADKFDANALFMANTRLVMRLCRRRYGPGQVCTDAMIYAVLRDLMLQRIELYSRRISRLADDAADAANQVALLNRVLASIKPERKGKSRRGKRS
jgi:hypothetical protein